MPSRKVFVARHGERLDFVDASWRASAPLPDDPPLTPRGELQAAQLGARLRGANITSVYASPFQRCTRTAALAAAHCISPIEESKLTLSSSFPQSSENGLQVGACGDWRAHAGHALKEEPEDVCALHEANIVQVNVEPALCERLSTVRYHMTEKGPLWRSVTELSKGAGVVDDVSRINEEYRPAFPYTFNSDAYPESIDELNDRCATVVRSILKNDNTAGNILLVAHVSSVKAIIAALSPESNTFALRIPYCSLSTFALRDGQMEAFDAVELSDNSFQSNEAKSASVSEVAGGFARTKYVLTMARGLVYSAFSSK